MRKILSSIVLISIVLFSCNNREEKKTEVKEEEYVSQVTLEELEKKEKEKKEEEVVINDIDYLRLDYKPYLNMINEIIVKGTITNKNNITYKNVILEIIQESKTKEIIKKERKTIYEYITPGKEIPFKLNLGINKDVDDVTINLISVEKG